MNISNLNGILENSDNDAAMNLIKFLDRNDITWIKLNTILTFDKRFREETGFNYCGKWNVIGNLSKTSPFITLKKKTSKGETFVSISYDILKEYKDRGLIYEA